MIYLICQDWLNTSGNHAGIKYLCEKLEELEPNNYKCYCAPSFLPSVEKRFKNRYAFKLQAKYAKYKHSRYKKHLYNLLKEVVKPNDTIILMEYMEEMYPMLSFAQQVKRNFKDVSIHAMVHLVPSKLDLSYPSPSEFNEWVNSVDKIITLGSSLTEYFVSRGVQKEKMITTFHYVDDYYFCDNVKDCNEQIRVIAMGSQMRNNKLLSYIVKDNKDVHFTICQGLNDMSPYFQGCDNVTLVPFVPESELRRLMAESDISLNSMEDTIGSNVIVTSLAMGLAMVCSNVGSIHDYCDESNTIFCKNSDVESFSSAIAYLNENRDILKEMKLSAKNKAKFLTIENFRKDLKLKL